VGEKENPNPFSNDIIASEVVRSMSDSLLVFDFHGRILSINPAAMQLLSLDWEHIREKTYADLFLNDSANDEFSEILVSCIQNRQTRLQREVTYRKSDGRLLDLVVTTSLLKREGDDRREGGVVFLLKDISELKALDRARMRVLDHLSHELRTPLAILSASLKPHVVNKPGVLERMERNLGRLEKIQSEVDDIVRNRESKEHYPFRRWLDQILDLEESLAEGEPSCEKTLGQLRERVESLFALQSRDQEKRSAKLGTAVQKVLETARQRSAHRRVELVAEPAADPEIAMNSVDLENALMAPLKNGIENTPDGGIVSVSLKVSGNTAQVEIRDTGVGITKESRRQIFGGFYHARETRFYSSMNPFDFGAGGKGLDLLRLRIFAEVNGFRIDCESTRCRYIPNESDLCPGDTSRCSHIRDREECFQSGGTSFRLSFPVGR